MNELNRAFIDLFENCEKNYGSENLPDDYIGDDGLIYCGSCHTKKQCLTPRILTFEPRIVSCPCKCQQERETAEKAQSELFQRVRRNTANANIPTHYGNTKLEMLDEANRNFAVRYLADFYENSGDTIGLLLYGDVGTGKSFLASCLANDMLSKGYSVRWLSAMQIVEQGAFYSDEDYRRYVDDIIRPDVLIIDDLGAERGTEFAMERVFSLVDTRVSSDKPLIVTTNVDINAMGQCSDLRRKRTFDRVLSATFPYVMRGVSRRMRSARENFDRYKDRFLGK